MKRISVCGHFGFGKDLLNGQTVKTKIITCELEKYYGSSRITRIDTHGGKLSILKMLLKLLWSEILGNDIVILPAYNGVRVVVPFLYSLNKIFNRRVFYVVIGGWLPSFIEDKSLLEKQLKTFSGIYVETQTMKADLEKKDFSNVEIIPNCKELLIVSDTSLHIEDGNRKLCTFSRVMKEKGIQEAVDAVIKANAESGSEKFSLDIFGQVDLNQKEWFESLMKNAPSYIRYGGLIPFDKSSEVLKNYYLLLFPTYHEGEGFAGTLIDAMAAGIPVIATDWKYNKEIVNGNKIGRLVNPHNVDALKDEILRMDECTDEYQFYRKNCSENVWKYLPENAIKRLIQDIGE